MKKILFFIAVATVVCSCNKLTLPDDWKEINAQALENQTFKATVGEIDPEQTWNLAQDLYYASEDFGLYQEETVTTQSFPYEIGLTGEIEDDHRQKASPADYYTATSGFYLYLTDCKGDADSYSIGIYYTTKDKKGNEEYHETVLWDNVKKSGFKASDYKSWTSTDYKHNSSFGFFLKSKKAGEGEHTYYSERSKNGTYEEITSKMYNAAGIYWFFFDDGFASSGKNFRAITLKLTCAKVTGYLVPLDYDKGPWMLVCEDYGSECDNDFNDVVMVVKRPNATTVNLELVAAGATRNNIVYLGSKKIGEVHELFGVPEGTMVNTYNGSQVIGKTTEVPIYSTTLTVTKDWTMSSADMGGFRITSMGEEGVSFDITKKGTAPYMIVIPANLFSWPVEQISIFEAYPQFEAWAKDKTVNPDWYMHPVEGKVYVKSTTY